MYIFIYLESSLGTGSFEELLDDSRVSICHDALIHVDVIVDSLADGGVVV